MLKQVSTKNWAHIGLWALFWHLVVTTIIGVLMPDGSRLAAAHQFVLPLTDLIPNIKRYAEKSIDPVFSETFIGCSLMIAGVFLAIMMWRMPAKQGKVFFKRWQRFFGLIWVTSAAIGGVSIVWLGPISPVSEGRAYFIIQAATSSYAGIVMVMNSVLVSIPLFMAIFIFMVFRGTSTHLIDRV